MTLERLKELAGKATPGPWRWTDVDYGHGFESYEEQKDGPFSALWSDGANKPVMVAQDASSYRASFDTPHDVDASFLLALRNHAEALLEVAEAAKALCNNVNDDTGEYEECWQKLYAALAKLEAHHED